MPSTEGPPEHRAVSVSERSRDEVPQERRRSGRVDAPQKREQILAPLRIGG